MIGSIGVWLRVCHLSFIMEKTIIRFVDMNFDLWIKLWLVGVLLLSYCRLLWRPFGFTNKFYSNIFMYIYVFFPWILSEYLPYTTALKIERCQWKKKIFPLQVSSQELIDKIQDSHKFWIWLSTCLYHARPVLEENQNGLLTHTVLCHLQPSLHREHTCDLD